MNKTTSVWSVAAAASLTLLLATGAWAELDALGPSAWFALAALYLAAWYGLTRADRPTLTLHRPGAPGWVELAVLLPLAAVVAAGWHDDFPFSGDHDHHLLAVEAARQFWSAQWAVALLGLIFVGLGARFGGRSPWPLAGVGALIAASYAARIPAAYFARYPATLYSVAAAALSLFTRPPSADAHNVVRLINVLAAPTYLLILRPTLFGRRASPAWLVPAVFLFAQPDALDFFDSVYLEPWPLVLLLVAGEALITPASSIALAPLVAGLATAFKETAALPFLCVGLASLWRARRRPAEVRAVLAVGTVAVIPFLLYYAVRREEGVWRTLGLASWAEAFTADRVAIFKFRLIEQFGPAGLVVLLAVVTLGCVTGARRRPIETGVLVLGGLLQIPLFFADRISLPWPGYPRFYFMAWVMMLTPTLGLDARRARLAAAALALGFAPRLVARFGAMGGPSYARNFTEDYAAAIRTPVRATLALAELTPGQVVRWIHGSQFEHDVAFGLIYPDLLARFAWESARAPTEDHLCRCAPGVALLISTPQSRNLHARSPAAPYPAELDRLTDSCRSVIANTCRCFDEGRPAEARLCVAR